MELLNVDASNLTWPECLEYCACRCYFPDKDEEPNFEQLQ
jgi:hypothetical protein